MQHIVVGDRQLLPGVLTSILPARLCRQVEEATPAGLVPEELRVRRGRAASVTVSGRNIRLCTILSGAEMDDLLLAMCEGSLYAHSETVSRGYLILKDGIRVGVCGRAGVVDGRVMGVSDVSALCIRLPHPTPPIGCEIVSLLHQLELTRGVLIYGPPAEGKTSLLRSVAAQMAGGEHPLRVAVVDTRGELGFSLGSPALLIDLLSGYPRGLGISVATRTLSAQLIVCDEIGDMGEAKEIVEAHTSGVPLLASAHAACIEELLARPGMRLLHESRCFGAYVRLFRQPGNFQFRYDILGWEAADGLL